MKLGDRLKAKLERATRRYRFAKNRPGRFSAKVRRTRKRQMHKWRERLAWLRSSLAQRRAARRAARLEARQWGGSRRVTNEVIRIVGGRAQVTSRKRTETYGNPGSDHHVSQTNADAVDFGIAEAHWLKHEISRKLGGPSELADYGSFNVKRGGHWYRVQIIAGTHGTGPHLHVGVRRI